MKSANTLGAGNQKKHRVTFIDSVEPTSPIARIYVVESFKKYNNAPAGTKFGVDKSDDESNENACCVIF